MIRFVASQVAESTSNCLYVQFAVLTDIEYGGLNYWTLARKSTNLILHYMKTYPYNYNCAVSRGISQANICIYKRLVGMAQWYIRIELLVRSTFGCSRRWSHSSSSKVRGQGSRKWKEICDLWKCFASNQRKMSQQYSLKEVAQKDGTNDQPTWIVIKDIVYDVTNYMQHVGESEKF